MVIVKFSSAGIFSLLLGEALIATRPVPAFGTGFLVVFIDAFRRREPFSTGSPTDGCDLERGRGERGLPCFLVASNSGKSSGFGGLRGVS